VLYFQPSHLFVILKTQAVNFTVRCLQSQCNRPHCGLDVECATLAMFEDDDGFGLGSLVAQKRSAGAHRHSLAIHLFCTHYYIYSQTLTIINF